MRDGLMGWDWVWGTYMSAGMEYMIIERWVDGSSYKSGKKERKESIVCEASVASLFFFPFIPFSQHFLFS